MNKKRREVKGRIFQHNDGLGTVTRRMIEERAEEIALIEGRRRPTKQDRLEARRELLAMNGIRSELEELETQLDSLDPSDTRSLTGRQAPNFLPEDEEQVPRDLVEQGIEEADHEQMVQGHFRQDDEDVEEDLGRAAGE